METFTTRLLIFLAIGASIFGMVDGSGHTFRAMKINNRVARSIVFSDHIRNKRQTDFSRADPSMACSMRCMVAMKTELGKVMDERQMAIGANFDNKIFTQDTFSTVCAAYINMQNCVSECGSFSNKQMILGVFRPLDFVCVEHFEDFLLSLPCYEKSRATVERVCFPKCGDFQQFEKKITNVKVLYGMAKPDEIVTFFTDLCNYTSCLLKCQNPIYNTFCDSGQPALLQIQFVAESISATQKLLDQSGRRVLFPSTCQSLVKPDLEEYKNNFINENEVTNDFEFDRPLDSASYRNDKAMYVSEKTDSPNCGIKSGIFAVLILFCLSLTV